MTRPCFLVVDREYPGSLSTRKLVLETAKFNVITAYSAEEAVATLARFPGVDGVVIDMTLEGLACPQLIERLRAVRGDVPVVTVSPGQDRPCSDDERHVGSHDPRALLALLEGMRPQATAEIQRRDQALLP